MRPQGGVTCEEASPQSLSIPYAARSIDARASKINSQGYLAVGSHLLSEEMTAIRAC